MGRLATLVAKDALMGEEVHIINCEKVMISGRRENTIERQQDKRERVGYPLKSQHHSRMPERVVRRAVRGMLPWHINRGKIAFKRVICHRSSAPDDVPKQTPIVVKDASMHKLPNLNYITIGELCRAVGGKQ